MQPLTEAFNSMLARMQHNMDAQRRFISDAAHQMRTPLTGLKMQAQLAMREVDPGQLRYALHNISSSVDRASHLVNQLLALARAEASEQSEQAPGAARSGTAVCTRSSKPGWFARSIGESILAMSRTTPVFILGNAFLLREMINNLLDNALRYTPDEGQVTARVVAQGDFVLLEIEDSGIGIADDEAHKVFDRFYRAERHRRRTAAASAWPSCVKSQNCTAPPPACGRVRRMSRGDARPVRSRVSYFPPIASVHDAGSKRTWHRIAASIAVSSLLRRAIQ